MTAISHILHAKIVAQWTTSSHQLILCQIYSKNIDFRKLEFSPLYSDAHCPIALALNIQIIDDSNFIENNPSISKTKLWNSDKSEPFINNIDILKVAEIEMHLDSIQNKNNVSKEEIDEIVLGVGTLYEATAKETFGSINMKKKNS